jgi:hypothetical protein
MPNTASLILARGRPLRFAAANFADDFQRLFTLFAVDVEMRNETQ